MHPHYSYYSIYLVISIIAGFISIISNAYVVDAPYFSLHQSAFASLINSPTFRPIHEYVTAIYYFIYFVVLPRYILNTESAIIYFFRVFRVMFIMSLVIGVVDLIFAYAGVDLVPRHISDWRHVGTRFHGLAGEPRDAFVYVFLGLAVFHLEAYLKRKSLGKFWVILIIIAAIMTQSASGLIGIAIFLGMFIIYILTNKMTPRSFFLLLIIPTLTGVLMYGAIINSERLIQYFQNVSDLWDLLESNKELPNLMLVQSVNIYPFYDLIVKARQMDILPILIGSGLGSASVINNKYSPFAGEMLNPNSQLIRTLVESGILGTFFFIMGFINPVKNATKHMTAKDRHTFIIITLLLIGCIMGHRSSAIFIYLGIFLAVFSPCKETGIHK